MIRVNSINAFKQELLPLIHLLENIIFNIFDPEGLKLFTRLRLRFSQLNENRFRHNFQECVNALFTCGLETGNSYIKKTKGFALLPSVHDLLI